MRRFTAFVLALAAVSCFAVGLLHVLDKDGKVVYVSSGLVGFDLENVTKAVSSLAVEPKALVAIGKRSSCTIAAKRPSSACGRSLKILPVPPKRIALEWPTSVLESPGLRIFAIRRN